MSINKYLNYDGLSQVIQTLSDYFEEKLDNNLGTGNSGKILSINEDGDVVPVENIKVSWDDILDAPEDEAVTDPEFAAIFGEV